MDLSNLTNLLLYMFLISAIAEKLTETFKQGLNLNGDSRWKMTLIHVASVAFAGLGAFIVPPQGIFMLEKLPEWGAIITVGILGSSGSGIWHDMIGLVNQYKTNQKALSAKP